MKKKSVSEKVFFFLKILLAKDVSMNYAGNRVYTNAKLTGKMG